MLIQHPDAERLYLAETDGFEAAGRFEPQREPADTGKEIKNSKFFRGFVAFLKGQPPLGRSVYHVA